MERAVRIVSDSERSLHKQLNFFIKAPMIVLGEINISAVHVFVSC